MDHVWDGFYTGQLRLSRFPAQLETGKDYTVEMAGTPPKKMRYSLQADLGGVKLKIPYPVAGSYTVKANGQLRDYTTWDKDLGRHSPLQKNSGCGENRYVGVENFLEFFITPGCEILVEPRDAIMTKVRLEWTLADFYADGGVTRFVDRMAAALGVPAHRIKTVAVYEGSVIVDFEILANEDAETAEAAAAELAIVQQLMISGIENGSIDLGAEILGLQSMEGEVYVGTYIPGADEVGVTVDHSAIVGDSNLWDDLIVNRDGQTVPTGNGEGETTTTTETSSSTDETVDTTSSSDDITTITKSEIEDKNPVVDNSTKARTQIVTVVI